MPLRIYRSRTLSAANIVVLLVGASSFGMWFFVSLYLQQVLGYSPIRAGLAFLPMTLCIVAGSTLASRLVGRVGAKPILITGMASLTVGLFWFTDISPTGTYLGDMLFPSLLTAMGIGLAFVPATISAVAGVAPQEAGLASGLVNTARLFGGALGLAVLAAIATSRTTAELHHAGTTAHAALVSGFQLAFVVSAGFALVGGLVAAFGLPRLPAPRPGARDGPGRVGVAATSSVTMRRAVARCFVTRDLPGPALGRLRERHEVDVWPERLPPPYDELRARTAQAEGLLSLLTDRVDAALIEGSPQLRAIANYAVGYDNVDLEAAQARGIAVGNTPDVLTDATADLTFTLLLAAARRLPEALPSVQSDDWVTWEPAAHLGHDVHGATLGIIGMGRIGRAVARRADGL